VDFRQPPIPLGRDDCGVAQDLLEGGQTTTLLQPPASERVSELMDVKPDPGELGNLPRERAVARERDEPPDATQELSGDRHPPHLPRLGLRDHEQSAVDIGGLGSHCLAPPQSGRDQQAAHEPVGVRDRADCSIPDRAGPLAWPLAAARTRGPRSVGRMTARVNGAVQAPTLTGQEARRPAARSSGLVELRPNNHSRLRVSSGSPAGFAHARADRGSPRLPDNLASSVLAPGPVLKLRLSEAVESLAGTVDREAHELHRS